MVHHPGGVTTTLDDVIIGRLHEQRRVSEGCQTKLARKVEGRKIYRKYVKARAEVHDNGDTPVARCLFLG